MVCMHTCSVANPMVCGPYGSCTARLLCPWDFLGKNLAAGFHFLLQEIFPTLGSNSHLLHLLNWQADSLSLSHLGSPYMVCCCCS